MSIFAKFHKDWAKIVDFLLWRWDFKIAFLMKLQLYIALVTIFARFAFTVPCKRKTRDFADFSVRWPFLSEGFEAQKPCHSVNTSLQTVGAWRLPKRYYFFMCLKGLQSCKMSKFQYSSNITLFFLCVILSNENNDTYDHFQLF